MQANSWLEGLITQVDESDERCCTTRLNWKIPRLSSILLRYGANPNAKDGRSTPLHMAAETCSYRTLACLLDNGAEVDAQDDMGATPLMLAAEEKSEL